MPLLSKIMNSMKYNNTSCMFVFQIKQIIPMFALQLVRGQQNDSPFCEET